MTIPEEKLNAILTAAVQAPSGDNSQPWTFQIQENRVSVFNVPGKDTSLFNYKQTSNHIALGAAIENMRLAARTQGYEARIGFFPKPEQETLVAEVTLEEQVQAAAPKENSLAAFIDKRSSNRKNYTNQKIAAETLDELQKASEGFQSKLSLVTDKDTILAIAHAVSGGEKIALENKNIHNFLFQHVTWSKEADDVHPGFYIKTFEFKPPQEAVFKLFSNWNILRFFNLFGVADFIAKDMEGVYASSAAFGAISIPTFTKENAVESGMLLERVWLVATKAGLGFHATTAMAFLMLPLRDKAPSGLSPKHEQLVRERYQILEKAFGIAPEASITFIFRLGYAEAPSARTKRLPPIIEKL